MAQLQFLEILRTKKATWIVKKDLTDK